MRLHERAGHRFVGVVMSSASSALLLASAEWCPSARIFGGTPTTGIFHSVRGRLGLFAAAMHT